MCCHPRSHWLLSSSLVPLAPSRGAGGPPHFSQNLGVKENMLDHVKTYIPLVRDRRGSCRARRAVRGDALSAPAATGRTS